MKYLVTILALVGCLSLAAQSDEQQVKQVVLTAYIDGIHNGGPVESIRKGFHPTFTMLRLMDNEVKPLSLEDWIKNLEASRAKQTATPPKTEGRFVAVNIDGTAASVVLGVFRDGKQVFTDNLLLYKFNEGWRIVTKTFYRHP